MVVLNLPFKALMILTLMRPSLVLFLVLWLKLVKDFLKVRCRLALQPFLISCLIWLGLVASLPLIKESILVIILLMRLLGLMLGSVLVLMLFFQAEDGIRYLTVTGVQTCALPICCFRSSMAVCLPFSKSERVMMELSTRATIWSTMLSARRPATLRKKARTNKDDFFSIDRKSVV